jgi:transcriptional regulator with XRE-family HTH domain
MKVEVAFGMALRKRRKQAFLSQESLALQCGLDRTFISALERGIRQPSLSTIFKISKTINISPTQLVKDVESLIFNDQDHI